MMSDVHRCWRVTRWVRCRRLGVDADRLAAAAATHQRLRTTRRAMQLQNGADDDGLDLAALLCAVEALSPEAERPAQRLYLDVALEVERHLLSLAAMPSDAVSNPKGPATDADAVVDVAMDVDAVGTMDTPDVLGMLAAEAADEAEWMEARRQLTCEDVRDLLVLDLTGESYYERKQRQGHCGSLGRNQGQALYVVHAWSTPVHRITLAGIAE